MTDAAKPAAKMPPQQYAAGSGWDIGDTAPSDVYRQTDDHGAPFGPVSGTHPGDRAVLIVAEGQPITPGVRAALDAAETDTTPEK